MHPQGTLEKVTTGRENEATMIVVEQRRGAENAYAALLVESYYHTRRDARKCIWKERSMLPPRSIRRNDTELSMLYNV